MGYLTDKEIESLRVTRMIIHLVGQQDEEFAPREEIPVQQEGFFRARIQSEAGDGVHAFADTSAVKPVLEKMARGELEFEDGGQQLARRFWDLHVRQSVSGAFFVIELRTNATDAVFYALIKYDYREAVELANDQSTLRAIVQAFVKEKKAVQKFCLVRVTGGAAAAHVCASDRMKDAPDLTDYFEKYLGVYRTRSDKELSDRLDEAIRGTMEEIRHLLPGRDVGGAVGRAKTALQGRNTVTNDDVVEAVLHAADRPTAEDIRADIDRVTRKRLRKQNLQDVEFRPDPDSLKVRPRRLVKTAEQVRLEFPAEEINHTVFREHDGELVTITIKTRKPLVEDGTLPNKTR